MGYYWDSRVRRNRAVGTRVAGIVVAGTHMERVRTVVAGNPFVAAGTGLGKTGPASVQLLAGTGYLAGNPDSQAERKRVAMNRTG